MLLNDVILIAVAIIIGAKVSYDDYKTGKIKNAYVAAMIMIAIALNAESFLSNHHIVGNYNPHLKL